MINNFITDSCLANNSRKLTVSSTKPKKPIATPSTPSLSSATVSHDPQSVPCAACPQESCPNTANRSRSSSRNSQMIYKRCQQRCSNQSAGIYISSSTNTTGRLTSKLSSLKINSAIGIFRRIDSICPTFAWDPTVSAISIDLSRCTQQRKQI